MDDSVPLSHYRTHEGCGVLLICNGCAKHQTLDLETVIRRVEAKGGSADTGIRAVASFVDDPCPRCSQKRWETRPAFALTSR